MKIALVESDILWENKRGNIGKLADVLDSLSASGRLPALIALPEMSFTGFTMNTAYSAEDGVYETINEMKKLSEKYMVSIAFGWVKRVQAESGNIIAENHYTIVNPSGETSLDYAKIHPFSYSGEDKFFVGGDKLVIADMGEFHVGVAICYDLRFPELFQKMADKAELILLPANWPEKRREHFQILSRARAIETQCYIAAVNRKGMGDGLSYSGDTSLIAPDGKDVLPQDVLDIAGDTVYLYDVKNDVNEIRDAFPVRNDRRCDLYKRL